MHSKEPSASAVVKNFSHIKFITCPLNHFAIFESNTFAAIISPGCTSDETRR